MLPHSTSSLPPPPVPTKSRNPWKLFGIAVIAVLVIGAAVAAGVIIGTSSKDDASSESPSTVGTSVPTTTAAPTTTAPLTTTSTETFDSEEFADMLIATHEQPITDELCRTIEQDGWNNFITSLAGEIEFDATAAIRRSGLAYSQSDFDGAVGYAQSYVVGDLKIGCRKLGFEF